MVDGDFGKPVRILVPEGRARRQIAEGPRALQHSPSRGNSGIGRQHGSPHPGHGITETIDVDDLAEVVRPVCPAIRVIFARLTGWKLAPSEHSRDRCKKVAPMKAGREMLRFPVDIPAARLSGTALDQLEQAIAGTDIPSAVGLENN